MTTNYFMEKPYVFRNDDGTLTGLFVDVMDGLIEQVCKTCSVNGVERKSTVDWVTNGTYTGVHFKHLILNSLTVPPL